MLQNVRQPSDEFQRALIDGQLFVIEAGSFHGEIRIKEKINGVRTQLIRRHFYVVYVNPFILR